MAADTLKVIVKAKAEIVNGYTLPPEPYNVVNNSTLIGIDTITMVLEMMWRE